MLLKLRARLGKNKLGNFIRYGHEPILAHVRKLREDSSSLAPDQCGMFGMQEGKILGMVRRREFPGDWLCFDCITSLYGLLVSDMNGKDLADMETF